jgi:hypothetical protein
VIDITLGSLRLLENIIGWGVSSEPPLSDHRYILFTLRGSVPVRLIRNPRDNSWFSFKVDLWYQLDRDPEMNMKMKPHQGLQFTGFSRP